MAKTKRKEKLKKLTDDFEIKVNHFKNRQTLEYVLALIDYRIDLIENQEYENYPEKQENELSKEIGDKELKSLNESIVYKIEKTKKEKIKKKRDAKGLKEVKIEVEKIIEEKAP